MSSRDKKQKKRLKREAKKKKEKAQAERLQKKLKGQMNMFDRMPEACSTCHAAFPKTREAHMAWRVVVRNEKQQVRLFCPECIKKVNDLTEGEEGE